MQADRERGQQLLLAARAKPLSALKWQRVGVVKRVVTAAADAGTRLPLGLLTLTIAALYAFPACAPLSGQDRVVVRTAKLKVEALTIDSCSWAKADDGKSEEVRIAMNLETGTLGVMLANPTWEAPGSWFSGCRVVDKDHWTCTTGDTGFSVGTGYSMWNGRLRYSSVCTISVEVE